MEDLEDVSIGDVSFDVLEDGQLLLYTGTQWVATTLHYCYLCDENRYIQQLEKKPYTLLRCGVCGTSIAFYKPIEGSPTNLKITSIDDLL